MIHSKGNPLADALSKRRAGGMEISINVSPHAEPGKDAPEHAAGDSDNEKNGLAPTVKDKMQDVQQGQMQAMDAGIEKSVGQEDMQNLDGGPMMEGLDDYDKERLMTEKPSSLGSRARKMMLERIAKK